MCGKFTQMLSWSELHSLYSLLDNDGGEEGPRPDDNDQEDTFTPMRSPQVIRLNETGQREMVTMRWGWPERWDKSPNLNVPKHMHAMSETIHEKPTFKKVFAEGRRGILPVKTFNVGEVVGKKVVQHVLTPVDGKPLGLAVIWDQVPAKDGQQILAFVMVTTAPNELIATVTDRMPAILAPEQWGLWLGETAAPLEEVRAACVPWPGVLHMAQQAKAPPGPRGFA